MPPKMTAKDEKDRQSKKKTALILSAAGMSILTGAALKQHARKSAKEARSTHANLNDKDARPDLQSDGRREKKSAQRRLIKQRRELEKYRKGVKGKRAACDTLPLSKIVTLATITNSYLKTYFTAELKLGLDAKSNIQSVFISKNGKIIKYLSWCSLAGKDQRVDIKGGLVLRFGDLFKVPPTPTKASFSTDWTDEKITEDTWTGKLFGTRDENKIRVRGKITITELELPIVGGGVTKMFSDLFKGRENASAPIENPLELGGFKSKLNREAGGKIRVVYPSSWGLFPPRVAKNDELNLELVRNKDEWKLMSENREVNIFNFVFNASLDDKGTLQNIATLQVPTGLEIQLLTA
jgi:hypothetical protein